MHYIVITGFLVVRFNPITLGFTGLTPTPHTLTVRLRLGLDILRAVLVLQIRAQRVDAAGLVGDDKPGLGERFHVLVRGIEDVQQSLSADPPVGGVVGAPADGQHEQQCRSGVLPAQHGHVLVLPEVIAQPRVTGHHRPPFSCLFGIRLSMPAVRCCRSCPRCPPKAPGTPWPRPRRSGRAFRRG